MIGIFCFNFVAFFICVTYFSALCTAPEFIPSLENAYSDESYRSRFGMESTCLRDLKNGIYNDLFCDIKRTKYVYVCS